MLIQLLTLCQREAILRPMSELSQRREEEKEQRRAEIIDAAEAVYADVGWDAATVDQVARRARHHPARFDEGRDAQEVRPRDRSPDSARLRPNDRFARQPHLKKFGRD